LQLLVTRPKTPFLKRDGFKERAKAAAT